MKKYFFLTIAFLSAALYAQPDLNVVDKPLVIGEIKNLQSKILYENRILNIYLPPTYDSTKSYPVIYLLDGSINEDFLHITGLVQFFNLMLKMPDCIVIGIANVDRKRDFTFPTTIADLKKDYPTTGHSEKFIRFLEEELQPFVANTYNVTDTKYLIGQSLGGLLAAEILVKKPHLFTHYFIISPSIWWDDQSLLNVAKTEFPKQKNEEKFVYISVGKGEHPVMQRDAEDFYKLLQNNAKKNLRLEYKVMPEDNHATILHRSVYEGLYLLFPYRE